jgi:catechol 2,3-dioxygenase-like lactoylglutathione lyase family enzyme
METTPKRISASPFTPWKAGHVGLRASDFAAAVAWYTEKLDFRLLSQAKVGELTIGLLSPAGNGEFTIELLVEPEIQVRPYDVKASFKTAGWHHACFRSEDVDQDVAELKRRDVTIIAEPREIKELGISFALFTDPWGNILEVIKPTAQ